MPPSCCKCARLADPAAAKVTLLSGLFHALVAVVERRVLARFAPEQGAA